MKTGGASLTGICSDPEHPASLPKRPAALPASIIIACRIRDLRKGHQPGEIGIFVRSTAGLMFREKYSFLTLHPVRLLV
jgi:hypothetical protein